MSFITPKRAERVLIGFIVMMFIALGGLMSSLVHHASHPSFERPQLWVIEHAR